MIKINKNRDRGIYTFANINLLGNCNAECYFCLGRDLKEELHGQNQLNMHFNEWLDFRKFLDNCRNHNISKLYLTGQTADGLQYKYLSEIVDELQGEGFTVGVRSNGYLAKAQMSSIKKMKDEIGYSLHSLDIDTNQKIMGKSFIPDWGTIIPQSGDNVRISIVFCRYNKNEIYDIIKYISTFDNVRYIQIRRISTDTRFELLKDDIKLFEDFYDVFSKKEKQTGTYHLAQQYQLYGKEVIFWRTVETSCNSLNYFTDGTCSDEYFIVEGYLKNQQTQHEKVQRIIRA